MIPFLSRLLPKLLLAITIVLSWEKSTCAQAPDASPNNTSKPIRVLFLGDNGHHRPVDRFALLAPVMAKRKIELKYTDDANVLTLETLNQYDALMIYANINSITKQQEQALLTYIRSGRGFLPIHCASYCFLNSPEYVKLVGAQFQSHGTGTFRTILAKTKHELIENYESFESWDETYQHHRHHEKDRIVLSYREKEPWTWIRTEGKGRVFYTAWGHDHRTWNHPGFHNLIERGIRWSVQDDLSKVPTYKATYAGTDFPIPKMTEKRTDIAPFEYVDVGPNIPNYRKDAAWGSQGDAINMMQKPLSAAESMKHFVTPAGFEVKLFASDPEIGKPICMNWDERGRLWIAETVDYPNELQPKGKGRDRIKICEDTNGDGRADKFTVFADRLSIPTSLIFANDGVIVHQAPETLFLKDTNGDDVADERTVLFSGWSTGDTHAGPSNLRYGLDNTIWGVVGYAGFNGTVGKRKVSFNKGFYRFLPDGSDIEFLRSTNNNTWGLGQSEEGLMFASTANRNPSVFLPIPNRYYEFVNGWSAAQLGTIAETHLFNPITNRVRQVDHHGGYTAAAGHALYTARTYPREYWNRTAFVCGPTGHLVGTFLLNQKGSDFTSRNPFNLLAGDDEWSAPIMAEVGPDGNVWVIDWYNYIVQHNPTPRGFKTGKGNAYISSLRDKKHGRIYRIVYKSKSDSASDDDVNFAAKFPKLSKDNPKELVKLLSHPNMFWRLHAQRLLVERGGMDVAPDLIRLIANPKVDEVGLNVGAIHALWTLHGLDIHSKPDPVVGRLVEEVMLQKGFKHRSAGVRRAALMVCYPDERTQQAVLQYRMLQDSNSQVRLAALLKLVEFKPSERIGRAIAGFLLNQKEPLDRWLMDAATSAAAQHDLFFFQSLLQSLIKSKRELPSELKPLVNIVGTHFARNKPKEEEISDLIVTLASSNVSIQSALLPALANGWPKDHQIKLSQEAEDSLPKLIENAPVTLKVQVIELAKRWGSDQFEHATEEIANSLKKILSDAKQKEQFRIEAAKQLISFRENDREAVQTVLAEVTPQASPTLSAGLIESLRGSRVPDLGKALMEHFPKSTPSAKSSFLRLMLSQPALSDQLLTGIEQGVISPSELKLDQKQSLIAHPSKELAARAKVILSRRGGLPNPDRQKVLESLLPITKQTGNASAGHEVFKKQCSKCHTHRGEGTRIGPDLTGMAVHPKEELLTHLIDPSRDVEGTYRVYAVVTETGRSYSGMLASETRTTLELIDTEAKRHVIQRAEIEELTVSKKSVMPEGFEKQVKKEEIRDLLEFLTQRGKYLPLDLQKVATIVSTKPMFYGSSPAERIVFPDWKPKSFQGVTFHLVDPKGDRIPNIVMLNGPYGKYPPTMPKSVSLRCGTSVKSIHMLSGIGGWNAKQPKKGGVSMIVRLHYADGTKEDHPLVDGQHFADYIGRFDVPLSKFAFKVNSQQVRYLAVHPKETKVIEQIEFVKGNDHTAPLIVAVTLELPEKKKKQKEKE